jgi:predicted dehydrogenase
MVSGNFRMRSELPPPQFRSSHPLGNPFVRRQAVSHLPEPFERSGDLTGAVLLGFLGCERSAERFHLPAIARLTNARLTAAYDARPEQRQRIARMAPGCRPFDTPEALLAARVVDAVIVASPPGSQASLAVMALGAGVPVLIEPPLAASLEEAEWIREAERAVRLPVMVGFTRRWWPPVNRLRLAVSGPKQEELRVDSEIVFDVGDADPFLTLADHLDVVRYVADREFATVSGRHEAPGEVLADIIFHGGGKAICGARPGVQPGERISVRFGTRSYEIKSGSERFSPATGPWRQALDLADSLLRRVLPSRDRTTWLYQEQLRAFIGAIQSRTGASPGVTDGVAVLLATEALRRSLEDGGAETPVPATPAG